MVKALRIFVFEEVKRCTDNQHDNGGLIILAQNQNHAREMIEEVNRTRKNNQTPPLFEITPENWKTVRVFHLSIAENPEIIVFPNAGCC